MENLLEKKQNESSRQLSQEDELLEEAFQSLKNWEHTDNIMDTESVIDFGSMEKELTDYALNEI